MKNEIVKLLPNKNNYIIQWGDFEFQVENTGDSVNVMLNKNINLGVNGEIGIASSDNFCIDTIGSKVYINSRKSQMTKNTEEAKEYIRNQEELQKRNQFMIEKDHSYFIDRIDRLEKRIEELEK